VEYRITARGKKDIRVAEQLRNYGLELMDEFGVKTKKKVNY
jgi:DNA-binding HxlR family transcriptional regulator